MGDAVLVAVPAIGILVFAMVLIVRGSRQEKMQKATAHALWKVGAEPNMGAVVVFLYREVGGREIERDVYARVEQAGNHPDELAARMGDAEFQACLLNDHIR